MGRAIDMEKSIDKINLELQSLRTTIAGLADTVDSLKSNGKQIKTKTKKKKAETVEV